MRINLLSSFAAGILITTTICSAVYFSDHQAGQNAKNKRSENHPTEKVQLSENEMKDKLVANGYVVLNKAEYDKNMKGAKASEQKPAKTEETKSEKTVTQVVVNVSEGMTSIDVGNTLVKANMIPNAFNFSKDIEQRGLEKKLRPGTYVVDSSMSIDQVIATIFK